ncbi:MAG TPA: AcvB/VirJ family lysyl-phosphatidylglycerol hydrolase, partial [Gemmatimonadaceae bacterium]|nr:AcvB/VirJ family lysyl-phosphatidylglycerol hydrolase [Gemmatimonadaceae bacterium]
QRLVLLGYSRGADVAPFIANRLSAAVRKRLDGLVLISPSGRATFELTLRDVVTQRPRATDLPVMPELERLRGTPLICAYGGDERSAFCTRLDSTLARTVVRSGGHALDADDGPDIAKLIVTLLGP